jgi:hypothetical protein
VTSEPQPASLGIPDPEPLDGRGLLFGLFAHERTLPAGEPARPVATRTHQIVNFAGGLR